MPIVIDDYVLYADDDPDDRFFLKSSFNNLIKDKRLEVVDSGEELLKYLDRYGAAKGLPCLIILDQQMPFLRGDEVIKILKDRKEYADIPVVIFSTLQQIHLSLERYNIGFEIKPENMEGWRNIAEKLLRHCQEFKAGIENSK